ncbi:MAG: hypothetical protein HKO57_04480, partial [Akkermansiaceae bacterium]|nr:hypothetical protein [Akkermansiaceae bacterium]
ITFRYSFHLGSDLNWGLARVGIRDEGPNPGNGFDSRPQQGFKTEYRKDDPDESASDDGSFRIYPDLNDTNEFNAMVLEGAFVGISPGTQDGSAEDLQSDDLRVEYVITHNGAGTFNLTSLSVTNEATGLTAFYTGPPQSFSWSATDAFLTQLLAFNGDPSFSGTSGGVVFEFFPVVDAGIVITRVETVGGNLEVDFRAPPGDYILSGSSSLVPGSFGFAGGPVLIAGGAPATLVAGGVANFEDRFFVRVEEDVP